MHPRFCKPLDSCCRSLLLVMPPLLPRAQRQKPGEAGSALCILWQAAPAAVWGFQGGLLAICAALAASNGSATRRALLPASRPCPPCSSRHGRGRLFLAILLTARADYIAPQSLLTAWDVGRRLAEHMNQLPQGSVARLLTAAAGSRQPMQQGPQQQQRPLQVDQEAGQHLRRQQQSQRQQRGQQCEHRQEQQGQQLQHEQQLRQGKPTPPLQLEPGGQHPQGPPASSSSSSQRALGALLLYSYAVCADLQREAYHAVRAAARAAQMLEEPAVRAALAAQLGALESAGLQLPGVQPLLTADQLRCACWMRVAERGAVLLSQHREPGARLITGTTRPRPSPAQRAELETHLAGAVRALLELGPANVRCLMAAAGALAALGHAHQASLLRLQAFQLATAQRSQYWQLRAAAAVAADSSMQTGGSSSSSSSRAIMPAALALLEQANSMLACLEPLLPDSWVQRVRSDVAAGRRRWATDRAQAQLLQAYADDSSGGAARRADAAATAATATAAALAAAAGGQQLQLLQTAHARGIPAASVMLRKQAAARLASHAFGSDDDLAAVSMTDTALGALVPTTAALQQELDWRTR